MSEQNAIGSNQQTTRSVVFRYIFQTINELEKQIDSAAQSNRFTNDQLDFIVLIFDQFQKLIKLRHKSRVISNLLSYNFPDLFSSPTQDSASTSTFKPKSTDQGKASELTFLCDICDEIVPVLNNDLDYSSQLHYCSPYHLEVVSILRKIQESQVSANLNGRLPSDPSINLPTFSTNSMFQNVQQKIPNSLSSQTKVNLANGKNLTTQTFIRNSKAGQSSKQLPVPASSSVSVAEKSFGRFAWIVDNNHSSFLLWRHNMYYCCLCDANLPTLHNFDSHVGGATHRNNVATEQKNKNTNVSRPSETESIHLNDKANNVIILRRGMRFCSLCSVFLPSEPNFLSHTNSILHRMKLQLHLKTGNATSSPVAEDHQIPKSPIVDFIVTRDGVQFCRLCNVKIPGKAQRESHMNGSLHKSQLNSVAKNHVAALSTDNFIVVQNGKRFCNLCNVQLPGESQFNGHVNGSGHKLKLKEYELKMKALR